MASKTIEMWMDMLCGRERRVGVLCGAEISMGGANSVGWIAKGYGNSLTYAQVNHQQVNKTNSHQ